MFGVSTGLASHLLFYIRGEHHMHAHVLFYVYITLAFGIFQYQLFDLRYELSEALTTTAVIILSYLAALFASMIVYRVHFHRLRSFPGPRLAKVSKFWHVYQARHSMNHHLMERMHSQYGSFVRTGELTLLLYSEQGYLMGAGPSELTVFVPEALPALDGPKNTCTKSAWYDLIQPLKALNTIRSKAEHDWRRRSWDKGFTTHGTDLTLSSNTACQSELCSEVSLNGD